MSTSELRTTTTASATPAVTVPIKTRRTNAETLMLREAIYDVLRRQRPMTLGQVRQRLAEHGLAASYRDIMKHAAVMRRLNWLPAEWLRPGSRWDRDGVS